MVGLARVSSRRDVAADLVSAFANPVVGLVKHPRAVRPGPDAAAPGGLPAAGTAQAEQAEPAELAEPAMVVRDATATVDEIAAAARSVLPGVRVRRRLFFRHTLEWTAPR